MTDESPRAIILFVDDDERLLESLRLILRRSPYEVLVTASIARAQRILESQHVDVVVCDERLPASSGLSFLSQLSVRGHGAVRILMSGAGIPAEKRAEASSAVFRFLSKPASAKDVALAIDEALLYQASLLRDARNASSRPAAPSTSVLPPSNGAR